MVDPRALNFNQAGKDEGAPSLDLLNRVGVFELVPLFSRPRFFELAGRLRNGRERNVITESFAAATKPDEGNPG